MPETNDGGWILDDSSLDPFKVRTTDDGSEEEKENTGKDSKKEKISQK